MKAALRTKTWTCGLALLACQSVSVPSNIHGQERDPGLTRLAGVRVGHYTMQRRPTGCTVVLFDGGAVGGVDVRGGAPGTAETDLLRSENLIQSVHAVVLAGGSAFGLDASTGTRRFLEEQGVGYNTGVAKVPIVPSAILYDLGVGNDPSVRPTAECGYEAAKSANGAAVQQGNVGAGAGATVGKLRGMGGAMKSGIGSASIALPNGLVVAALVAVNAVGDVVNPETGEIIAGARRPDGGFVDVRSIIRNGTLREPSSGGQNTTIGVVATNARLDKVQVNRMATVAHNGYARAIVPVHTPVDGDAIFGFATGTWDGEPEMLSIGALAADVMAQAIVRAVMEAKGIPGFPAAVEMISR